MVVVVSFCPIMWRFNFNQLLYIIYCYLLSFCLYKSITVWHEAWGMGHWELEMKVAHTHRERFGLCFGNPQLVVHINHQNFLSNF